MAFTPDTLRFSRRTSIRRLGSGTANHTETQGGGPEVRVAAVAQGRTEARLVVVPFAAAIHARVARGGVRRVGLGCTPIMVIPPGETPLLASFAVMMPFETGEYRVEPEKDGSRYPGLETVVACFVSRIGTCLGLLKARNADLKKAGRKQ